MNFSLLLNKGESFARDLGVLADGQSVLDSLEVEAWQAIREQESLPARFFILLASCEAFAASTRRKLDMATSVEAVAIFERAFRVAMKAPWFDPHGIFISSLESAGEAWCAKMALKLSEGAGAPISSLRKEAFRLGLLNGRHAGSWMPYHEQNRAPHHNASDLGRHLFREISEDCTQEDLESFGTWKNAEGLGPWAREVVKAIVEFPLIQALGIPEYVLRGRWEEAIGQTSRLTDAAREEFLDEEISGLARAGAKACATALGNLPKIMLDGLSREERATLFANKLAQLHPPAIAGKARRFVEVLLAPHEPMGAGKPLAAGMLGPASSRRALALLMAPKRCIQACAEANGGSMDVAAAWCGHLGDAMQQIKQAAGFGEKACNGLLAISSAVEWAQLSDGLGQAEAAAPTRQSMRM